ncbi:putative peptidase [Pedobacter sp. UYP30]|uniref:carboxylesterase family protein n=1 Tax=Pedobacter sp. UYP30 TaxID=1756400 RepID=UPI003390B26A
MKWIRIGLLLVFAVAASNGFAQDTMMFKKVVFAKKGDTLNLRVLYPKDFDSAKTYPILFFLHGSGERGNDNESQLVHGSKQFLKDSVRNAFPSIVVFPQCPANDYWSDVNIVTENGKRTFNFQKDGKPTKAMHALLAVVKDFLHRDYVDKSQVYVGGLSMGGMGTYEMLRRKRHTFAAAFAICGGDNLANVKKYKHVPLWIFHGAKDDVVDPAFSVATAERLKVLGDEVKLTIYPNANHNSWDSAFAEPGFLPWLYGHRR